MDYIIKTNKLGKQRFFSKEKPTLPNIIGEKFETKYFTKLKNSKSIEGGLRCKNLFKSNYERLPLISVVIPNLNGERLKKTLDSVINQDYPNIEIILIDGGSKKNNCTEVIKEYENEIDYWISEEDDGIYDGWNKGINVAFGKYFGILNSNDVYYENAFVYLLDYIKKFEEYDFILGAVEKEKVHAGFRPKEINLRFNIYPSSSIGFFIKLDAQKKIGLYNIKYKCSSDYDMFYKLIKKYNFQGVATKHNEVFGKFEKGGFSSKLGFFDHLFEEIQIRFDNGQNIFILIYIFLGRCIIKLLSKLKIIK